MLFTINDPNAYERFQLNFLVTYSTNFFYFPKYHLDFNALSNDMSQVLWNNVSVSVVVIVASFHDYKYHITTTDI